MDSTRYKNLHDCLNDITVFGEQINQRPTKDGLWYSEVLINKNQKDEYYKSIQKIKKFIEHCEEQWEKGKKPREPKQGELDF